MVASYLAIGSLPMYTKLLWIPSNCMCCCVWNRSNSTNNCIHAYSQLVSIRFSKLEFQDIPAILILSSCLIGFPNDCSMFKLFYTHIVAQTLLWWLAGLAFRRDLDSEPWHLPLEWLNTPSQPLSFLTSILANYLKPTSNSCQTFG